MRLIVDWGRITPGMLEARGQPTIGVLILVLIL